MHLKFSTILSLVAIGFIAAPLPLSAQSKAPGPVMQVPRVAPNVSPLTFQKIVPTNMINANIDSSIVGAERSLIASIMAELPEDRRENVVYFTTDGRIFANHQLLKAGSRSYKVTNNSYYDDSGRLRAVPGMGPKPVIFDNRKPNPLVARPQFGTPDGSTSGNTGAYRRVYAQPNFGNDTASFNVPCGTTRMAMSSDAPYIYGGGWGNNGYAIDAGFQLGYDGRLTAFVKSGPGGQMNLMNVNLGCGTGAEWFF